jgi:hypothetical protein
MGVTVVDVNGDTAHRLTGAQVSLESAAAHETNGHQPSRTRYRRVLDLASLLVANGRTRCGRQTARIVDWLNGGDPATTLVSEE